MYCINLAFLSEVFAFVFLGFLCSFPCYRVIVKMLAKMAFFHGSLNVLYDCPRLLKCGNILSSLNLKIF